MLTWKEFERANAHKAFEIAADICQKRTPPQGAVTTADIAAEMNLILWEWFDDYKAEHV